MLKKNFLKEKIKKGKTVLGTWAIIPSEVTANIIANAGLDFIIIDMEHGPISFETAQKMIMACEECRVSPVIRVGGVYENEILRALDIGAHCIQIPNIDTEKDVVDTIKFAKYPPIGNRGFSPYTRAGGYTKESAKILTNKANENTLIAINVEGKKAIDNIDKILALESLDIVFIGTFDLSKALGIPGQINHKKVQNRLEELTIKINDAGKVSGTIVTELNDLKKFIDLDMKYIVYSVDCAMLSYSYQTVRKNMEDLCHG